MAGADDADEAMLMNPTGRPDSAPTRAASRLPLSCASGETVHSMIESSGRFLRASFPPARTAAMSTAARASASE